MVEEKKLALIPEALWKEFITLPCVYGSILNAIAFYGGFSLIPTHLLTPDNLTEFDGDNPLRKEESPLAYLATFGGLHLVPWETFSPRKWIPHIGHLKLVNRRRTKREKAFRRSASLTISDSSPNGCLRFIAKVEALKKLKEETKLETIE
jgi:hypothetical protein